MMRRRTDKAIDPQALIDELLHSSLEWPGKTTRLERNCLLDYLQRSTTVNPSIAELYHENSKLFPQVLPELTAVRVRPSELRRQTIQRRAAASKEEDSPDLALDGRVRELLTAVVQAADLSLFYAVELRVLAGAMLTIHEPVSDTLRAIKRLAADDQSALGRALRLMSPQQPPPEGAVLFIVGRFAYNDILFGPRGYRRTLLETGQVAEVILLQARRLELAVEASYEFADRDVDAVIEADGIEDGTLAVLELGGATNGG